MVTVRIPLRYNIFRWGYHLNKEVGRRRFISTVYFLEICP